MEMIGSKNFIVKRNGETEYNNRVLNRYLITYTKENSQEILNVNEDEVNELIGLLQAVKEVL